MEQKITRYLSMLACLIMGCAIGFVIMYASAARVFAPAQSAGESAEYAAGNAKYREIMDVVKAYYIGENPDETDVNDAMAAAMIASLGDRWSYYISASDYQDYVDNINNAYVGVGITITASYDESGALRGYEVIDVTAGGPAEGAGVMVGDVLIAADGTSVTDISLTETKNLVKGEEGSTVVLTFLRGSETVEIPVERHAFTLVPAEGEIIAGNVGYITIDNFDSGCAETVKGLVEQLQAEGAESLLFDVRNNPGGLKTELTDLLDYLLPEGTIFHTVNYAGDEEIVSSDESCVDLPMAVLVNADSYSAAEYFACAIQEYGVGKVIGVKTFGKGYYQVGINLSDGSCVNLSIGKYYTPNGVSLIDVGVTPDVERELDDELALLLAQGKLEPEDDPQVQAALDCLLP